MINKRACPLFFSGFIDDFVRGSVTAEQLAQVRFLSKALPAFQRRGFKNGLQFIDTGASDTKYVKQLHGILLESPEHAVPRGTLAEELQHAIDVVSGFQSPQRIAAWERIYGQNYNTVWHQGVFRRIADALEASETSIFHFFLETAEAARFRQAAEALGSRII